MRTERRTSLQRRFFIFILTASLLMLIVSLGANYVHSLSSVAESTRKYLQTYIDFADSSFSSRMSNVKLMVQAITLDRRVLQAAAQSDRHVATHAWFMDQMDVKSYLDSLLVDKSYVKRMAIILSDGDLYHSTAEGQTSLRDLNETVIQNAWRSLGLTALYDDGVFLLTRPIRINGAARGVVYVELDGAALFAEYALQPLEQSSLFMFDDAGNLIHTTGPEVPGATPSWLLEGESGVKFLPSGGYYLLKQRSGGWNMTVVAVLTLENLLVNAFDLGRRMLFLFILTTLLMTGISYLFSRSLFSNLNILMECMRSVRKGDLSSRAQVSTRDEISEAAETFNDMMEKIKTLMADIHAQEAAKRAAEQQMLEAQIHPHFVYNSISAMQYAAQMRGQADIEKAAGALGELMRSVLGNHHEWITLWEERNYIEQYVVLQRFKFKNQFTLRWEVAETLWAVRLPKLLLQPLVENALIHGIHQREGGEIVVSAHSKDGRLLLRVVDNGKGMEAEQVAMLMDGTIGKPTAMRRIGINNVRQRIDLCYCGQAQFDIVSIPDSFTCVELNLPMTTGGEGYDSASGIGG